jgi:hypothetical protein
MPAFRKTGVSMSGKEVICHSYYASGANSCNYHIKLRNFISTVRDYVELCVNGGDPSEVISIVCAI